MTREENINIKIQNGEKLTLNEALSVLNRYHFDWRCRQALDVVLEAVDPWHYPSKGEYPPKGREVLCVLWNGTSCVAYLREDNEWTTNGRNAFDNVRVWQYIEPPKDRA